MSLRERTTAALRDAILRQRFKPGEQLVERKLCSATGASRTCVRDAVRHLESEGLVERVPDKGMFVATVSPADARSIDEVRAALEPECSRLSPF